MNETRRKTLYWYAKPYLSKSVRSRLKWCTDLRQMSIVRTLSIRAGYKSKCLLISLIVVIGLVPCWGRGEGAMLKTRVASGPLHLISLSNAHLGASIPATYRTIQFDWSPGFNMCGILLEQWGCRIRGDNESWNICLLHSSFYQLCIKTSVQNQCDLSSGFSDGTMMAVGTSGKTGA